MKRRGLQLAAQRTPYQGYFTDRRGECQVELHNFICGIAKNYAIKPKETFSKGRKRVDMNLTPW
jgi:hypothetical protein